MATKIELQKKKELARVLFMSGEAQDDIAEKTGTSRVTVSRWVKEEGWKEKRAAASITRPELIHKNLLAISKMLDDFNNSNDPHATINADKLCKLANTISNLDKKTGVVEAIEVFTAFGKWLQYRAAFDVEVSKELVAKIVKLQDDYISELISGKIKL
jgi:transposase